MTLPFPSIISPPKQFFSAQTDFFNRLGRFLRRSWCWPTLPQDIHLPCVKTCLNINVSKLDAVYGSMRQPAEQSMKVGYIRVSKHEQHEALQLDALEQAGCEKLFMDKSTGAKVYQKPCCLSALAIP